MTCSNELTDVRYDNVSGYIMVKDANGTEKDISSAITIGPRAGFSWSWKTFDDGCQCFSCNRMHDAYADFSIAANYGSYNPVRRGALRLMGWMGDSSKVKMAEGWVKTMRSPVAGVHQEYPMGLVCCRCNSRNEYAGAEHLKDGKYVCYNCK